jgi:hypothetical protein
VRRFSLGNGVAEGDDGVLQEIVDRSLNARFDEGGKFTTLLLLLLDIL